ncbi:cytospin-A-like [Sycon ciliatum]|uniref:cytospin-A-like n=1 Tax=Sycon ciliatum TaxID=27933 RepID=UPI0031F6546C
MAANGPEDGPIKFTSIRDRMAAYTQAATAVATGANSNLASSTESHASSSSTAPSSHSASSTKAINKLSNRAASAALSKSKPNGTKKSSSSNMNAGCSTSQHNDLNRKKHLPSTASGKSAAKLATSQRNDNPRHSSHGTVRRPAFGSHCGNSKDSQERERQLLDEMHQAMMKASMRHRGVDPSEDDGEEEEEDDGTFYSGENSQEEEEEEEDDACEEEGDTEYYDDDEGGEADYSQGEEEEEEEDDDEEEEENEDDEEYDESDSCWDEEEQDGKQQHVSSTELLDEDSESAAYEDDEECDEDEETDVEHEMEEDEEEGEDSEAETDNDCEEDYEDDSEFVADNVNYPHRSRCMTTVEEEEEEEEDEDEEDDEYDGQDGNAERHNGQVTPSQGLRSCSNQTDGRDSGFGSYSSRVTPTSSPGSCYSNDHGDDDDDDDDGDADTDCVDQDLCSSDEHSAANRDSKELRRVKKQQAHLRNALLSSEDKIGVVQAEKDVLTAQLRMAKRQLEMYRLSRDDSDSHTERIVQKMAKQLQDMQSSTALAVSDKDALSDTLKAARGQHSKDEEKIQQLTLQLNTAKQDLKAAVKAAAETERTRAKGSSGAEADTVIQLRSELDSVQVLGKQRFDECREAVAKLTTLASDFERRCDSLVKVQQEKAKKLEQATRQEQHLSLQVTKLTKDLDEQAKVRENKEKEHHGEVEALGKAIDAASKKLSSAEKSHAEAMEALKQDLSDQIDMKDIQVKKFQDEAEYLRSTVREQEQRLIVLNELELRVAELQVGEEVLHNQINEEMEDNKRLLKQKTDLEAALQQEKANRKALEERLSASVSRASLAAPTAAASAAGGATAGTSTSATPSKRPRKEKLTSKKNEVSQSPALDSEEHTVLRRSRSKDSINTASPSHTAVPVRTKKSRSNSSSSHRHSIASSNPAQHASSVCDINEHTQQAQQTSSTPGRKHSSRAGDSSTSSCSVGASSAETSVPSHSRSSSVSTKKQMLLEWCRLRTKSYKNVDVRDFSRSWSSGLAFCALIHSYQPRKIAFDTLQAANKRENFQLAFSTAEKLGVAPLLDVHDMVEMEKPDWMSVMTYVASLYNRFAAGDMS